jgi:hypothetical protein
MGIVLPPVQTDLFGFVYRTHEQANANREQFDVRQGNANVAGDH